MSKRSYSQYCGIAYALDLVGERWTLLLLRELTTGPKRYKDLLRHLSGIGTNLLAARLKFLEEKGVIVRRMLPPPASTEAYDLTDHGRALEPVLVGLAQWGRRFMGLPSSAEAYHPGWTLLAMKSMFQADKAEGLDVAYEYRIEGEVFHAHIKEGALTTRQGHAPDPAFIMIADTDTFLAVAYGLIDIAEALASGQLILEGSREAFLGSYRLFGLKAPVLEGS